MIRERCHVASISSLLKYYPLRWLGRVCRMTPDALPPKVLFADTKAAVKGEGLTNSWKALWALKFCWWRYPWNFH